MIEIVSIHLPKTGGSSFLETLKSVYGEECIKFYNRNLYMNVKNKGLDIIDDLTDKHCVVHGHVYFKELKKVIQRDHPRIITWFRNPVDRVVSNYYWWQHDLRRNKNHPAKDRIDEPLEIYITRKETRNKMYKFLKGITLEEIFFFGFLETFDDDINELASLLNWKDVKLFHEKNSVNFEKKKTKISEKVRKKIIALNKKDVKLFNKMLQLKGRKPIVY